MLKEKNVSFYVTNFMFYVGCIHRVGIDRHDGVA